MRTPRIRRGRGAPGAGRATAAAPVPLPVLLLVFAVAVLAWAATAGGGEAWNGGNGGDRSDRVARAGAAPLPTGPARAAEPAGGEAEAVHRLERVFALQDRAVRERDGALLRGVFAPECPCLRAGLERIRQLDAGGLRWAGYRSAVSEARAEPAGPGAWRITAVVTAARTRVETESAQLLRVIPEGRQRWVFVLAPPAGGGPLLLTSAEPAA